MPGDPLRIDAFDLSPPCSGDPWLAWTLDAHPEITVGRPRHPGHHKLPEVLRTRNDAAFTGLLDDYRAAFGHRLPTDRLVDLETFQLIDHPRALAQIDQHNPDARFLVVLRDPVERLVAHHRNSLRLAPNVATPRTLRDALNAPGFLAGSRYGEHLAAWFDHYGQDRFCVLLEDDILQDPEDARTRLYRALGVDPSYVPNGRPGRLHPRSGGRLVPEAVGAILRSRNSQHTRLEPRPKPILEARLRERLMEDIERLEGLIGRDLGHWLHAPAEPAARPAPATLPRPGWAHAAP